MSDANAPPNHWRAAWVMYDMTVNYLPRLEAFRRLLACGYSRRQATEEIRSYEREP